MLTVYETPTHYVEDREYIQLVSHFLEKNLEKQYQDAIQKPPNLDLTNGIHGFNKIKHRSLLTAYAALIVDFPKSRHLSNSLQASMVIINL
ncbi:unnamed protein product [Albugo candida]|uniref:Uncharacterized protein n=1 Tax=Albugo candida TaxID=65357 RepID=A0A024G0H4_9STRA|nr:unnamed protein product [Albugo candida]|eukprot:CCI40337.1 unnamed protein product [Albugo candida]